MSIVLRAWEAVSPERDLRGVLAAVSGVILPAVPFDGLGIVIFAREEHRRLYILHLVGQSCSHAPAPPAGRPRIPYENSAHAEPHSSGDLLAKKALYPHEFRLAAAGIRAYATMPLHAQGKQVGVAVFGRRKPIAFTEAQMQVLRDITPALSVAVSNALAYEEIRKLRDRLEAENVALKEQLGRTPWAEDIIGNSAPLRRVIDAAEQVAGTEATVLITGETGTGKEMIARAIHRRSRRAHGPLIKVNCAAIPGTLLASELFGHERGAFTGAQERRKGRFEQAHGGSLFLDEIAAMTADMQVLLLRVLQEREFERLGGSGTLTADVRVIAATNRNLIEEVRAGRFREDLFYRLNVFPVHMPPLRERLEDLPVLVAHFAAKHGERHGRVIGGVDQRTMKLFESYLWPGNVRELENLVERAVITSRSGVLHLPELFSGPANLNNQLRSRERESIEAALRSAGGRVSGSQGAAALLGLPASTLESRIKRLGIDKYLLRSTSARPFFSAAPTQTKAGSASR